MDQAQKHPKFAIIGDPLPQSAAVKIHLALLRHCIPEATCERVLVPRGELPQWLERVRAENYSGFCVDTPHKLAIGQALDELVMEADVTGSVSLVLNQNGRLHGHSTDALGVFAALRKKGITCADKRVLILGSGGSAGALAHRSILNNAERVEILARQPEKAHDLVLAIRSQMRGAAISWGDLDRSSLRYSAAHADLVINTTPRGMAGQDAPWPDLSFLKALPPGAVVCDMVYNPKKTALLEEAERLGFTTQNGIDILLYQALMALRLYINQPIDYKTLEKVAADALAQEETSLSSL